MNHVHIEELIGGSEEPPTPQQAQWLGERLRDMWDAKLKREFPDRNVQVTFYVPEDRTMLLDYELTAFQERNAGAKPGDFPVETLG